MFKQFLKYGLAAFIVILPIHILNIFEVIVYSQGLEAIIVFIPAVVIPIFHKRTFMNGVVSYKEVLATGYFTGLFCGFWNGIATFLSYNYLNPNLVTIAAKNLKANFDGMGSLEEIERSIQIGYSSPINLIFSNAIMFSLIFTVISIVVGLVIKSKPQAQA